MRFDAIELTDADLQAVCGGLGGPVGNDAVGVQSISQEQQGLLNLLQTAIQAVANVPIGNSTSATDGLKNESANDTTVNKRSGE